MPFKSKKQRRWMYANHPKMAKRWERHTKGDLPEGVSRTCPSCEEGNHSRCRDEWCDCCGGNPGRMTEVFRIREMDSPISNRPPPGSKPVDPTDWTHMGTVGQNLRTGLDGLKKAGQDLTAYTTPDGERIAYPNKSGPGAKPLKADDVHGGIWTPMTGSAAGETDSPFTPKTTMK